MKNTTDLHISLPKEQKRRLAVLADLQGKTTNKLVNEIIKAYTTRHSKEVHQMDAIRAGKEGKEHE
jgi:predicted DNA-binding protein